MFKSILCPVDFSEHSDRALGVALKLAESTGAHLTIMTAVDPFLQAASTAAGHGETLNRQTREEMQRLLTRMEPALARLGEKPGVIVVTAKPVEGILDQLATGEYDVVVMGTQGLSGPKRLFFGSTTEGVLRASPVPVLAVPGPEP